MLMADAYIPCLKCKALIPQYVKEVHATECHVLKLRSFSHPRITGSSLIAQALIIGGQGSVVKESGSKNRANKQNETHEKNSTSKMQKGSKEEKKEKSPTSGIEEPDWLKKIWPGSHYRMAVINEFDLIHCNLTAFTPVLLEHSGNSNAFIVVPDNGIRVGHVMLHNIGVMQYFSSVSSNTLITIRKLANIKFAKEIQLSPKQPLSKEECITMEIHMKTLMFSSFPLGAPFTIRENCLVYPNSAEEVDSQVFTVKSCIVQEECFNVDSKTDQLLEDMSALHIQSSDEVTDIESSVSEPSLFADRNDEDHDGSTLSQAAYITIDEYKEGDSLDELKDDECFVTSTPNRKFNKDTTNICKTLLSSKSYANVTCLEPVSKDLASKRSKESASNFWFRVGRDTKITVERRFKSNSPVTQQTLKRDTYCKDNLYFMLKKIVENKLKNSETDNPFLSGWNGILLYGPPGTGKTLLIGEIARDMNVPVVALSLENVVGSSNGGSESVRQKFRLAVERAPSFLFIDEIDSLCPVGDHRISRDKDLTRAVINGIQLLKTADNPVFLIAATSRIEGVSQKLRCSGRFDKEILVPLPTAQQRSQILHKLISSHRHNVLSEDITSIARQAYGFSGADLNLLLKCAWFRCVQKNKKNEGEEVDFVLSKEDLQEGMAGVSPTVLRQNYQAISLVRWSDIYGYESLKSRLQTLMQLHIAEPENHPLRGILLYGPPGCSKTMFVKALVTETSFSFFPVKCSDLFSKYVGETEKSLVRVFERARQACPSIIFMDEVDSLCGDRAGGSGLVSELLSLMSENALPGNILVIGATNRPHALDEALLKPGCLEQVIHIDLPDYDCRCAMWSGILKDVPCSGEVDIAKLSQATEGYSGAEIRGVYQQAAQSIISCLASRKEQEKVGDTHCVTMSENCILESIASLPPRTPAALLAKIKEFSVSRSSLSAR